MSGLAKPQVNEMVDRIAAALYERLKLEWDVFGLEGMTVCGDLVRIVAKGMRDPSDAMADRGAEHVMDDAGSLPDIARATWAAMVDEMLREG